MSSRTLVALVAAAALALPAAAGAKVVTYAGSTADDAHVALDVKLDRFGLPKRVVQLRASNVPAVCDVSGVLRVSTGPVPASLTVTRPKFRFAGLFTQPTYGNQSTVNGRFSSKRVVSGAFNYSYHFLADAAFPEENCNTGDIFYTAQKNAPDLTLQPPAARR